MSDSLFKKEVQDDQKDSELPDNNTDESSPEPVSGLETKNSDKSSNEKIHLKDKDESKASAEHLDTVGSKKSGNKRGNKATLNCPDTDSCLNVSQSPNSDSKKITFDFSMIDPADKSSLTAALQTEQEFLDFMFSLPQIQKEEIAKEKVKKKVVIKPHDIKNPKTEKKVPTKCVHSARNSSRAGFDHLDNLCRMMDQLGELREQNTKLQRRVQYLEELKTLQEMHRDMHTSLAARKSALSLGSVSLSDSDLRLEDINKSCVFLRDSEDSLDQNGSGAKSKGKNRLNKTPRVRSHSMGTEENLLIPSCSSGKGKKISRWSRVREAFRWERVSAIPEAPPLTKAKESHHPLNPSTNKTSDNQNSLEDYSSPYSIFRSHSPASSDSSTLSQVLTEEDILNLYREAIPELEIQRLMLPETSMAIQRHSSSEDDRRVKEDSRRSSEKEKKGHKSAWGKVKHMISYNTKRENVRKKSSSGAENSPQKQSSNLNKSLSATCTKNPSGGAAEGVGISDPEEYDLEYESMDPDGTSWEWDESEGGIWMGPKTGTEHTMGHAEPPGVLKTGENIRAIKRNKPQLTITVPSNENLHNAKASRSSGSSKLSAEIKASPGSSPSKFEMKSSPELLANPPSPRRSSNWSKVKNAFLTTHNHQSQSNHNADQEVQSSNRNRSQLSSGSRQFTPQRSITSQPPSPNKKKQMQTNFSFDVAPTHEESDSNSGVSPEISPDDILLPSHQRQPKEGRRADINVMPGSLPSSVVHKNLIDLQKTLTGEFNKKLQEWEKLKSQQGIYGGEARGIDIFKVNQTGASDNLPQNFKKKLHEWEKMKGRDKDKLSRSNDTSKIHVNAPLLHLYHHNHHHNHNHQHQNNIHEDLKTKKHDEDDLPPDFKKKLAEWEIRKALVGKGQQNVEQLQKNLGEEFNKKLAEWEKMKASSQGKISSQGMTESSVSTTTEGSSENNILSQGDSSLSDIQLRERTSTEESSFIRESTPASSRESYLPSGSSGFNSQSLDRKGSGHKFKKSKSGKIEKTLMTKAESQKNRDKELLWLEKELNKIDREKQRLEREKEKFLEREARLEKMRHAMRQGPAEKREIYIKTSTGEFRFEGISQTFTKKLYEWEERRGIRPESSTFVLLDPNYKAPEKEKETSVNQSPESKRIARSRSESSVVEMSQSTGMQAVLSHQSSISLNEMDKDDNSLQNDNNAASKPAFNDNEAGEAPKCAVLVQMEEELMEEGDNRESKDVKETDPSTKYEDPYAPAEITRLIDSSGSDENLKRSQNDLDDDVTVASNDGIIMTTPVTFVPCDADDAAGPTSDDSYRSLLHENMTLLGRLKEQENLCRALETQMGDIDTKMDNVADQHLKTLEKLHRQVSIMQKSESSSRMSNRELEENSSDDAESNERLISQLKARIAELEVKGDRLMEEKEELEKAFKLHKSHETEIAESLLLRIRELQDAGAEVNIHTVQCQTDDSFIFVASEENVNDQISLTGQEEEEISETNLSPVPVATNISTSETLVLPSPSTESLSTDKTPSTLSVPVLSNLVKKKRRKKRDEYFENRDNEGSEEEKLYSNVNEEGEEDEKEEEDDEEEKEPEEEEEHNKKRSEKDGKEHQKRKKKLPPKKVQKLHSLTADLLFQAKRLEGALISRHNLPRSCSDRGDISHAKIPKKRSLKGRSSLRLSNEENKIHVQRKTSKGANANRTWSSIEAITTPEQELEDSGLQSYESRAAALASESQDLLAMNAELSRMAKELRKEMMSVWSFRESTSSESNSSDTREETIKSKMKNNDPDSKSDDDINQKEQNNEDEVQWLESEAREIFDSIASLQPIRSSSCKSLDKTEKEETDSDEEKNQCSSSESGKEDSVEERISESRNICEVQEPVVESEEHFQSWWDVPFPKKRKSLGQEGEITPLLKKDNEELENSEHAESADLDSVIPGSAGTRLSDLLKMEKEKEEGFEEDKDTLNIRLSPYYNITSPRVSRASSSTSDDDRKEVAAKYFFTAEKDELESANGTLNTNCSSTVKSDVLSSSFEYETKDFKTKLTGKHECSDDFYREQYEKSNELLSPKSNRDFTAFQLSKVQEIVKETRMKMESGKLTPPLDKSAKDDAGNALDYSEENDFETEVRSGFKTDERIGGLRTRRVSDSQIFYLEILQGLSDENNCYQNEYTKCFEKSYKPATRTPSIRRNQSESDVLWLKEQENIQNSENDSSLNIFVPTHRTIFTVSGANDSFATEVIPTFLPDDDVSEEVDNFLDDNVVKDFSSDNIKDEIAVSNDASSVSSQVFESKSLSEKDDIEKENTDSNNKDASENQKLSDSSTRSVIPFKSPPTSPSFINAFCSSYHQNSPPVKSKKMILEAANETSPTVKTMIDLYNRRITEKQEMLINPFKPGDPYTENKFTNINGKGKTDPSANFELNKGKVLKSQSTSILPSHSSQSPLSIQRSISGTNEVLYTSKFYEYESSLPNHVSKPINFKHLHSSYYGSDISGEFDKSAEESKDTCSGTKVSSPHFNMENGKTKSRASKLRKARNEFLSSGVAPLTSLNHPGDKFENLSDGVSTGNLQNCKESSGNLSNLNVCPSTIGMNNASKKVELRQLPVPRKESFRRQSESCVLDELTSTSNVLKSASSSGIEYRSKEMHGRPPSNKENRKSSIDATENKRSSKGIFKLFKKSKIKDRKDLSTVQQLCRQSLAAVEITSHSRISNIDDGEQPSTSYSIHPTVSNEAEDRGRTSKTLPREEIPNEASTSTSRSCPSSPVTLRKSKTAQWLSVGKNIFKSRSPSPNKRPR